MPSPPRPSATFFIDRSLGRRTVADVLRALGVVVQVHDNHFPSDCDDDTWIQAVARNGWLILTKDKGVRRREGHLETLRSARAAAFILTSGDTTGAENAQAFQTAMDRMKRIAEKYTRPVIATVNRSGKVTILEGMRRGGVKR